MIGLINMTVNITDAVLKSTCSDALILPEQFDIMITNDCNARCPFCVQAATYRPGNVDDNTFISGLRRHFDSFFSLGGRRVVLTGGEPTLNMPRVLKVLQLLEGYENLEVKALYTNGSLLLQPYDGTGSQTVAEKLKAAGLNGINFTVHDYNEEHKRKILGLDSAPETEKITRHLLSCGFSVRFNLTLHKKGIESYDQFLKYVYRCIIFLFFNYHCPLKIKCFHVKLFMIFHAKLFKRFLK